MRDRTRHHDYWRLPAFMLWLVFFGIGLAPEPVFYRLRAAGLVLTQDAIANSPYFITVTFAAYVGLFCLYACRQYGMSEPVAHNSAVQNGVIALLAFLPFPLELLVQAATVPVVNIRRFIYAAAAVKLCAWTYLLMLFLLYHIFGSGRVFAWLTSLYPTRQHNGDQADPADLATPTGHAGAKSDAPSSTDGERG